LYKNKKLGICGEKKLKHIMKIKIILFALATQVQAQTKVWFDTDLMIGMPDKTPREVDDGITLIMALKQPQIEIVGISSITYVDYSYDVNFKKWHHRSAIPVYKGSPRQMT
jgi:pyrimidine-specific ribonucleoside hydrolase